MKNVRTFVMKNKLHFTTFSQEKGFSKFFNVSIVGFLK